MYTQATLISFNRGVFVFEREKKTLAYFTEEEIINYCGGRHRKSWRGGEKEEVGMM